MLPAPVEAPERSGSWRAIGQSAEAPSDKTRTATPMEIVSARRPASEQADLSVCASTCLSYRGVKSGATRSTSAHPTMNDDLARGATTAQRRMAVSPLSCAITEAPVAPVRSPLP